MINCRICGGQPECWYTARETMFGLGGEFRYFTCSGCGCLQIEGIPEDLERYYDAGRYYSLAGENPIRRFFWRKRLQYLRTGHGLVGKAISRYIPPPPDPNFFLPTSDKAARVLDVGCGKGMQVRKLAERGYRNVSGIDPYMSATAASEKLFSLRRASLLDLNPSCEQYDVIHLSHTFEHIAEQHETLTAAKALLSNGGRLILRIPWADSFAWDHYQTDWIQLDAPRHLFLHTHRSMAHLASRAGLDVERVDFDSYAFQFWGSEQVRNDIVLMSAASAKPYTRLGMFTRDQIDHWQSEAEALNQQGRGDQVTVYLVKN